MYPPGQKNGHTRQHMTSNSLVPNQPAATSEKEINGISMSGSGGHGPDQAKMAPLS
jgi:hypothetical protein